MKCQSKIEVSISNPISGVTYSILIYGKMYECELAPKIYDPMTFELTKPSYVVTCEDGKSRKYYAEYFKEIVEVRADKLKELGI
jgi:hypothetical protein